MKRPLKAAAALLCAVALSAYASTSAVTATITDADGQTWNNGTWSAELVSPNGSPTIGGVAVPASQQRANGPLSSSGAFSATLADTLTIDQAGTTYRFTLTPNASVPSSQISGVVVTGATPNLSSVLSAGTTVPRFVAGPISYGYRDSEVYPSPAIGDSYYNVTTPCYRQFSLAGWTCGGGSGGTALPFAVDAEWAFNDGSGTTIKDISGNGHDATFGSGSNAPSWNAYGVAFNSTGDSFPAPQFATTNITTFKSVIIAHCVYPEIQTTGTGGNVPYAQAATLFGSSTANGINFGGGQSVGGGEYFGAFRPNTIAISPFANKAAAINGWGGCQTSALTIGANDALYENGLPVTLAQTGSSSAIVTSTGGYEFGSGDFGIVNAYRGTITYALLSLNSVWTAAQVQQLNTYIQAKLETRTMPVYPTFNQSLASQLIFPGDSIWAGHGASGIWTSHLALNKTYTVNNWAVGGMNAWDLGRLAESRWYSQVAPSAARNVVIFDGGTNDLVNGWSAADTWSSISLEAKKALAIGAVPVVSTLISRTGQDAAEAPLNALIRAGWKQAGFAALLDMAETPPFAAGGFSNLTYYQADGVHPNGGTVCTPTDGGGVLCFYASKLVNTLDGSSAANPDTTTSNTFVAADANNYVIQTPTAAATYLLVSCGAITGQTKTIVNGSTGFTITVSPTSPDTIVGSASIPAGGSMTYTAVNSSPTAGGCFWSAR